MVQDRKAALSAVGKGFAWAVGITAAGMLITAAVIVFVSVSDEVLTLINQIVKLGSVIAGAFMAVRSLGKHGLAVGAVVGLLYMVTGCGMYYALAGGRFTPLSLAAEFAIGAVVGALAGMLCVNVPARRAH